MEAKKRARITVEIEGVAYVYEAESVFAGIDRGIKDVTKDTDNCKHYEHDAAGDYWTISAHGRGTPTRVGRG